MIEPASLAAIALSGAMALPQDFATLPPEPAEIEQALTAARVTMDQAIAAAEKYAGGTAVSAAASVDGDAVSYEVMVASGGMLRRVMVDGADGTCVGAKMTLAEGIRLAYAKVPGVVERV